MVSRMLQAHGQLAPDHGGPAEEPISMTLVSQQTSAETSASSSPDMLSPMLSPMPPSVAPVSVDAVHDGCSPGGSGAVRRCRSSRSSVDDGVDPATFHSTLGARTSITATQLGSELLAGGEFLLLDVRSIAAYQRGHVQGALSVACSTMLQRYTLIPPATRPPVPLTATPTDVHVGMREGLGSQAQRESHSDAPKGPAEHLARESWAPLGGWTSVVLRGTDFALAPRLPLSSWRSCCDADLGVACDSSSLAPRRPLLLLPLHTRARFCNSRLAKGKCRVRDLICETERRRFVELQQSITVVVYDERSQSLPAVETNPLYLYNTALTREQSSVLWLRGGYAKFQESFSCCCETKESSKRSLTLQVKNGCAACNHPGRGTRLGGCPNVGLNDMNCR